MGSGKSYGQDVGKKDIYLFNPEDLELVTDEKSDLYDERVKLEPTEELVLNIMYYGVLEPVIGRKNNETGKMQVVDGRQRVKATIEANKRLKKRGEELLRVPVVPNRMDAGMAIGMMISANEQRIEDTPSNRARKAALMLARGKSEEEVAVAMGCSVSTLKNLLRLSDATAAVRKAADSGKITAADAYQLAKLEPEQQRQGVTKLVTEAPRVPGKKRSKNAKKARAIMQKATGGKRKKRAAAAPEAPPTETEENVVPRARNQVENVRRELQEHGGLGNAVRALSWVLGSDEALEQLLSKPVKGAEGAQEGAAVNGADG